jgi:hypothetical protein
MLIPGVPSSRVPRHSLPYPRLDPIGAHAPNARKPKAAGLRTLLFLGLLALVAACSKTPPEQALRETIAKMQAAGEARDIEALFEPISEDFSGSEGMDREAFLRYVTLMTLRQKDIGVTLGPIDVKLFGDRATANFTAAIRGGPGILPDQAQVYVIETGWKMEGDDWKLLSATWKAQL